MKPRFLSRYVLIVLLCSAATSVRAQTAPVPFPMLDATMTINVSGDDTKGSSSTITAEIPSKWGPPPHVHTREDEVYVVMRGHFRFFRGTSVLEGGPGSVVFFPRNVPHTFTNLDSTPGQLVFTLVPAGLEKMFQEISKRGLKVPQDIAAIAALGADYGVTYLPPPPAK